MRRKALDIADDDWIPVRWGHEFNAGLHARDETSLVIDRQTLDELEALGYVR